MPLLKDLYRGARLVEALDWQAQHPDELVLAEREFLDASARAAERERLDALARADREARAGRRLRGLLAATALLLAAALVAGGLAVAAERRASGARAAAFADQRAPGRCWCRGRTWSCCWPPRQPGCGPARTPLTPGGPGRQAGPVAPGRERSSGEGYRRGQHEPRRSPRLQRNPGTVTARPPNRHHPSAQKACPADPG